MGDIQGPVTDQPRFETPIIIIGAGPVGLLTAFELSRLGVPCVLAEQATETTKWPKMDLSNCRTMEIFRMLGIADELRSRKGAVGGQYSSDSIFYTSAGEDGHVLTTWPLPSNDEFRKIYTETNDGSHPAEPPQRCSQIVLEAWLKEKCLLQLSIESRFGWKYISHVKTSDGVESQFIDISGVTHTVCSKYLVGADGGGSHVRKTAGIKLFGAPAPIAMYLVHFRSKELSQIRPFGRFWHLFPPFDGFIIDQDEDETFTVHLALDSLDQDVSKIDPYEWVWKAFGGAGKLYRFKIDDILVASPWRPNFAIAEHYLSPAGRVVLAGDAAHRNPPHGGYGMNSGIEDALAVAWRLAAIHKGYGGKLLLQSYEDEQRPTMIRRLERCSRHVAEHFPRFHEGESLRQKLKEQLDESGSECNDRGIELDSRYRSAIIYSPEDGDEEPEWDVKRYTPSTYPGSRVPHVFLKDQKTNFLGEIAAELEMPLTLVVLGNEDHARKIWEYDLVLVRADGHVAWRGKTMPDRVLAKEILMVVTGQKEFSKYVRPEQSGLNSTVFPPLNQEYPKEKQRWVGARPWEARSANLE